MKKKWLAGILCAVMAISMSGCGGGSSSSNEGDSSANSGETINLKMSYTTSETSVWRVACEEFAKQLEEKTDGRYTVSIYANEQLAGGAMDQGTQMILDGTVDLDLRSITNYTNYEPRLYVITMPWIFSNNDDVDAKLFNGDGGQMIKDLIDPLGIKVLALGENGFRSVTNSKREITSPDDMVGLKFRVPAISSWVDTFRLMGADPTVMTFSEVFTALQQGTIDGQENPTDPIVSSKIYEVQSYLTRWNYAYDCLILSCSETLWNSLSDEDKAIFQECADAAAAAEVEASRAADADNFALMEENGVKITDLTEDQMNVFKEKVSSIYDQYRDQITDEVFEAFGYTFE